MPQSKPGNVCRQSCHSRIMAGVALAAIAATSAAAQSTAPSASAPGAQAAAPTPPASTPAPAPTGGLEEIVVTARRRTESVQDVPVAVTAISAADVQRRDLTSIERIAAATPQLVVGRSLAGSGAQMSLRGIGSNSLSIGTEQSIAVIVDGVYYGQGRTINEGFFDLAGVEILKGPQSLFFGKNATAGVISITSANPTSHLSAMVRGGYEFNGRSVSGEGYVSGPITDTLGFRVAVRAQKDFGYYFKNVAQPITYLTRDTPTATTVSPNISHVAEPTDSGPRERDVLTRATLRWEATPNLTATLKATYGNNRTQGGGWNIVVFACDGGFSTTAPTYPCTPGFTHHINDMPADIAAATKNGSPHNYNSYKSWGTTGTIDYNVGDIAITSVTNYNWNRNIWVADIDYQSSPTVNIWGTEDSGWHAISSELRALSKFDGPVNFLLGGYYQNTKRTFDQLVLNANADNSAAPAGYRYVQYAKLSSTKGETLSAYGQVTWKIVPKLEAAAGVRYIHETKDSDFIQNYVNPRFIGAPYVYNVPIGANQLFTNWSPEATLTYKPSRDITIYGAYKTAYKSGGFSNSSIYTINTIVPDFFTFDPEKSKGFEIGLKTTLFDHQVRFNIDAYTYKYTDLQVTYLDSAALSYNSVNAGSLRTKGVEAEFEYAPRAIEGFSINGSLNYNKARYGNSIAPCYGGQTIQNGCFPGLLVAPVAATPTTPARAGTPGQNLKGLPSSDAPQWTATLGVKLDRPISHALRAGFTFDSRYSSSYLTSPFGTPISRQPKYVNLDATAALHTADDKWEIAVIGKNLTNQYVATAEMDASGSGSGTGTAVGRISDQLGFSAMPRTVQLRITYRIP